MPQLADKYTSPFPPLGLTDDDRDQILDLSNTLLEEHITAYDEYMEKGEAEFNDKTRWKLVRKEENTRFYASRPGTGGQEQVFGAKDQNAHIQLGLQGLRQSELVDMRATGTVRGTLEDFMYGAMGYDIVRFRTKGEYCDDHVAKAAIVDTVIPATPENPFSALVVKYRAISIDGLNDLLMKPHHYVYMDYSGYSRLSNGDKVGYLIGHSINFPQTELPEGAIRGKIASCFMARQKNDNEIETFCRIIMENPKKYMRSIFLSVYGKICTGLAKQHAHVANMRKLEYMMQHHSKQDGSSNRKVADCEVCGGKLKGNAKPCRLCCQMLCKRCQIKQEICFIMPDAELKKPKISFCAACVHRVAKMDSYAIASDQIRIEQGGRPAAKTNASASAASSFSNSRSADSGM